jgi:hypothetical protein
MPSRGGAQLLTPTARCPRPGSSAVRRPSMRPLRDSLHSALRGSALTAPPPPLLTRSRRRDPQTGDRRTSPEASRRVRSRGHGTTLTRRRSRGLLPLHSRLPPRRRRVGARKIVVSPVRGRVSPSTKSLRHHCFCTVGRGTPDRRRRSRGPLSGLFSALYRHLHAADRRRPNARQPLSELRASREVRRHLRHAEHVGRRAVCLSSGVEPTKITLRPTSFPDATACCATRSAPSVVARCEGHGRWR